MNPTINDLPIYDENGNPVLIIRECENDGEKYFDGYIFDRTICFWERNVNDIINFFKRNYWWGTQLIGGYTIVVVSMKNDEEREIKVLEQKEVEYE